MVETKGTSKDPESDEATLSSRRGHDLKNGASESEKPDNDVDGNAAAASPSVANSEAEEANPPLPDEPVPPLPDEKAPPLPDEQLPGTSEQSDDGWEPVWDANQQAFYFYNRFSGATQWENPRVPEASADATTPSQAVDEPPRLHGGYNPAIHGDYDPTAPYALEAKAAEQRAAATASMGAPGHQPMAAGSSEPDYSASGAFNRFTGRWQAADQNPENFSDEAKSHRQMNAFFDVDAAANSHEGRSLKAERSGMKLSKKDLKAFKEKRREKKEEKRRAWLRD